MSHRFTRVKIAGCRTPCGLSDTYDGASARGGPCGTGTADV